MAAVNSSFVNIITFPPGPIYAPLLRVNGLNQKAPGLPITEMTAITRVLSGEVLPLCSVACPERALRVEWVSFVV
jgi:hypothetical protein